jgi:hypothetical protein
MAQPAVQPGEVFLDPRGSGRAMRVTWHPEADVVVLSLWRDHVCTGTFRLEISDVSSFIDTLVDGLAGIPGASMSGASTIDTSEQGADVQPAGSLLPPLQRRACDQAGFEAVHRSFDAEPESFADWAFRTSADRRINVP